MKKVIFTGLMLLTNMVFAQYIQNVGMIDGATGNLVYTSVNPPPQGADPISWSGFMNTSSTGGGYSGGYMPGWNGSTGTFMFGYSQGTIAYSTPVNYALSMAGTNIQVNGFKYSWEYLNQDQTRGTLSANINLTNTSGQVLQNYNYNMPYTTNGWTKYSGIENFNTQYPGSHVGNLNVSFTGKDDRFWAGYYGPQVRAIDVSLLYSAGPPPVQTDFSKWVPLTSENGSFTLETAGVVRYGAQGTYVYANFQPGTYSCSNSAWGIDPLGGVGKYCDFGTNTTTPTTTPTVPKTTTTATTDYTTGVTLLDPITAPTTTASISTVVDPVTTTSTPTTTTSAPSSQPSVVSAVVSAPAPATTSSSSTTTSSSSSSSSSSTTQTTKESTQSGGGNVSLALSVISKNSERDAAGSAVAQSAMAQAQQAANQAQQEAQSVASSAVSNSLTANAATTNNQQSSGNGIKVNSNSNSTNFTLQPGLTSVASVSIGPQPMNSVMVQQQSNGTGINVTNSQPVIVSSVNSQQTNTTSFVLPLLQPQQQTFMAPVASSTQSEQQQQPQTSTQPTNTNIQSETHALVPPSFLTDKSNPMNDIIEGKQVLPLSSNVTFTGSVVNKNAGDNEIAGGVSINKMALAPTGYGDYLTLAMRDAAFYAPKEVYRNQRNVDNARALRQMTSDSKHKEMVEMQYAR